MQHFALYTDLMRAIANAHAERLPIASDGLTFSVGDEGTMFCQANGGRLTAGFSLTLEELENLSAIARGRVCR